MKKTISNFASKIKSKFPFFKFKNNALAPDIVALRTILYTRRPKRIIDRMIRKELKNGRAKTTTQAILNVNHELNQRK